MATGESVLTTVRNTVIDVSSELEDELLGMLNKAQEDAEDRHHFKAIEKTFTDTTTDGSATLASMPSDWIDDLTTPFIWDGLGWTELQWLSSIEELKRIDSGALTDEEKPQWVYQNIEDDELQVYPLADTPDDAAAYTVEFIYWGRLTALTDDASSTNWFSTNMAKYLEYETTAHALFFNRDHEESMAYRLMAKSELDKFVRRDKRRRIPARMNLAAIRDVHASSAQTRM